MTKKIIIGRFGKTHGVKGWIRVISFTDPQENALTFTPWLINKHGDWQVLDIEDNRIINAGIIVKLKGIENCDAAKAYTNLDIEIEREQLPHLSSGQYYWADLEGMKVIDQLGKDLGIVDRLFATGSNDIMVIKNKGKELLIPYMKDVIIKVDLENKIITVDYEI